MQLDRGWLLQQGADAALLRAVHTAFPDPLPDRIGLAVSGGGDSVALLHLFARWSAQTGHRVAAVSVDHGLRPDSRAEAEAVAQLCALLCVPHDIVTWTRPAGAGNLAALARDGRYCLMADWAQAKGIGGIALGHTIDDSAENFLMRLGRSAGVDGLALMEPLFRRNGMNWARPLGGQKRSDLRDYLRHHNIAWADDPTNDDIRYLRTKARRALPALEGLGITADSVYHSAFALRQAQDALAHYTRVEARCHVREVHGDVLIPEQINPRMPAEIERRLIVAALRWVGSNTYPPRMASGRALVEGLRIKRRMTLGGCIIMRRKGHYHITREYNAVRGFSCATDAIWDTRWRLDGPHAPDLEVRALGEGIRHVPDWRATGLPRRSLMASPAVWRGQDLLAAPLAGYNDDWTAQIVADFTSFLESH